MQSVIYIVVISLLLLVLMRLLQSRLIFKISPDTQSMTPVSSGTHQTDLNVKRKQDYHCHNLQSIPSRNTGELHIMFIFHKAEPHGTLQKNFYRCVATIFEKTLKPFAKITCHIIGDLKSFRVAEDVFKDLRLYDLVKVINSFYYDDEVC